MKCPGAKVSVLNSLLLPGPKCPGAKYSGPKRPGTKRPGPKCPVNVAKTFISD